MTAHLTAGAGTTQANRPNGLSAKRTEMLCCVCAREDRARQGFRRCRPGSNAEPRTGCQKAGHRGAHRAALGSCRRPAGQTHTNGSPSIASVAGAGVAATDQGQGASKRTYAPRPFRTVRPGPGGSPANRLTLYVDNRRRDTNTRTLSPAKGGVRVSRKALLMTIIQRPSHALP
jgi:hypothetical protein